MEEITKKILKKTKRNYNIIASHFSYSRGGIWPDLKILGKEVSPRAKVLDIGCGNGRVYELLKDKNVKYLGIDFSKNLIQKAKKRYPKAKFELGDITIKKTWKGLKNKFDFVFCIALLHHLPSRNLRQVVVKQIWQALKQEGKVFATVWNLWQKKYFKYHFSARSLELKWQLKDLKALYVPYTLSQSRGKTITISRFFHLFTLKELKKLFQKDHFFIEKSWSSGRNFCLVGKKKV